MKRIISFRSCCTRSVWALVASGVLMAMNPVVATAQPANANASSNDRMAQQIEQLRAQVAQLQATLDQQRQSGRPMGSPGPAAAQQPAGGMQPSAMQSDSGCCMGMNMHKGEMGMPPEGMAMPQSMMMDEMRRMGGTSGSSPSGSMSGMGGGGMPASPGMNMGGSQPGSEPRSTSSLPGMPGGSHLYHIGSTGFFLDQPQITLTDQQQSTLNGIKERALLQRSDADRRVEEAEQELWVLTGADQPDSGRIQAKAREIEQIRTEQRLAFIAAVGEATKVLTAEQRAQLLGTAKMPDHE